MVHPSGGVHRYRKCSGCGFNFSTLETVIEDRPKLGRPPTSERVAIPKLKNTVTKRDAVLINKIRVEVRHKIEDDYDGDY
jgi:transcriptional regulator NrdR family protein